MKLIAHRGNTNGPNKKLENTTKYIEQAINKGFDVEIDLKLNNDAYLLGHDEKTEQTTLQWIIFYSKHLWIHCKNLEALNKLTSIDNIGNLNYFWHQKDDYTLTSKRFIWTYPRKPVTNKSVIVCKSIDECNKYIDTGLYGICSDYIENIRSK
tara:strand:- start:467 stop:925 length:459 start_codon:yes stop_codon:yes gene_type:complete